MQCWATNAVTITQSQAWTLALDLSCWFRVTFKFDLGNNTYQLNFCGPRPYRVIRNPHSIDTHYKGGAQHQFIDLFALLLLFACPSRLINNFHPDHPWLGQWNFSLPISSKIYLLSFTCSFLDSRLTFGAFPSEFNMLENSIFLGVIFCDGWVCGLSDHDHFSGAQVQPSHIQSFLFHLLHI